MTACTYHSTVPARGPCIRCGLPFCDHCLVELLGQFYCGPCRDVRVRELQGQVMMVPGAPTMLHREFGTYAGSGRVTIGAWLAEGWRLFAGNAGHFLLAAFLCQLMTYSCTFLFPPLRCGEFMMAYRRLLRADADIGRMFEGFRRFLNSLLALLLLGLVALGGLILLQIPMFSAVFVLVGISPRSAPAPDWLGWAILAYEVVGFVIVGALFGGATLFVLPDIAARNSSPTDAIAASWQVFTRNPIMFAVAALVFRLIELVGLLLCVVGIFVTGPVTAAAIARAYADHFGLDARCME